MYLLWLLGTKNYKIKLISTITFRNRKQRILTQIIPCLPNASKKFSISRSLHFCRKGTREKTPFLASYACLWFHMKQWTENWRVGCDQEQHYLLPCIQISNMKTGWKIHFCMYPRKTGASPCQRPQGSALLTFLWPRDSSSSFCFVCVFLFCICLEVFVCLWLFFCF